MLPAVLLTLVGGCFIEFSPLPIDAGRTETAVPDRGTDHAQLQDGPLVDKGSTPDTQGPDLPPPSCTSWSDWSCSNKPNIAVARCPKTGTEVFSLVCNTAGCSCTRLGGSTKKCSTAAGKTCVEVQAGFSGGCCSGL